MIQIGRDVMMPKIDVIKALRKHKANHIKNYDLAVIAFKKKAVIELKKASNRIKRGQLTLNIDLISPIKRVDYYDNVIGMFTNEVASTVKLSAQEYNEYILDKSNISLNAFANNSAYYNSRQRSKGF